MFCCKPLTGLNGKCQLIKITLKNKMLTPLETQEKNSLTGLTRLPLNETMALSTSG